MGLELELIELVRRRDLLPDDDARRAPLERQIVAVTEELASP